MSLGKQIASGVFWNIIQLAVQRSFSFIIKLVLARLLFPEDFGIIGMAAVFISFLRVLNDLGIGAALIQKKKESITSLHYDTAFWTGIGWSVFLYILIALGVGPLAAWFYEEPFLKEIIPVLGIGVLVSPVFLIHNIKLTRKLNFKKIAIINNSSNIFSGLLALTLAYLGFGVWSLVFNSVASIFISIPLYFKFTKWKPKLRWRKKEFQEIFGFGVYTTGTNLFNNIISRLDYLVIGKLLSANALGVYTLAFMLTDTLRSQLMNVMNKVMYPIYGRLQDNLDSIKEYYLKVVKYNSLVVYPVVLFMLILGDNFIILFFGDKWRETIEPLKILSFSVFFHMMVNSNTSLIRAVGKPKLEMNLQLFKALLLYAPLVYLGTYYYGIIGASWAIVINKILSVFIAQYYLKKLFNITYLDLVKSITHPILITITSGIIVWFFKWYFELNFYLLTLILFGLYLSFTYVLLGRELITIIKVFKRKQNVKKN